jgi:hypothetical protein
MAKTSKTKLWMAAVLLGLAGAAVLAATGAMEGIGFVAPLAAAVGAGLVYWLVKWLGHKARLAYLRRKYDDEQAIDRIMKGYLWQGQTAEQLVDSLGDPADVDRQVLKTKTKEIWKYIHLGGDRYGLRITLENSVVVGWDRKV